MKTIFKLILLIAAGGLLSGFGGSNPGGTPFQPEAQMSYSNATGPVPTGLQSCGIPPMSATTALRKALTFKSGCHIVRNSTKPMAINDYSSSPPMIYLYKVESGRYKCVGKTRVGWGSGRGVSRSRPLSCSDGAKQMTPPGFHVTRVHNGKRYNHSTSIGLNGLNGQGSVGRGVVMHGATYGMGGGSWGCPYFSMTAFKAIKSVLSPEGSMVYNYFGNAPKGPGCNSNAGVDPDPGSCRPDSGSGAGGSTIRGGRRGTRSTR